MSSQHHTNPYGLAYQPNARPENYNVVVIAIDDLRADHLSANGYGRETTPHLKHRLADATRFTNCHSPVGWTLPGCASIITGHLPDDHGLVDHNHKFAKPKIGHYLGDDYFRVAITNNGNTVSDQIDRETLERLGLKRRPAKWKFFDWNSGFDEFHWFPREDYLQPFERANELLERFTAAEFDRPWFLFFHTNVVHDYHMHRQCYLDGARWLDAPIDPSLHVFRDGPEVWREPPSALGPRRLHEQIVAKYDGGIRFMDEKVNDILSRVNFDDTLVIFTSDHGEGFDPEHGRVHHCGRLHSDLTYVPLIVWLPPALRQRFEPPATEERFCSTIDITPTLLTLLGDAVAGFPGSFLFDLPTHRRLEGCDRGYIYWNEDCLRESYDTCRIEIRSELTYPLKRIAARKNDTVRESVYNLAYDPLEHHNLVDPALTPSQSVESISFVVVVNDFEELRNNLLSSPIVHSDRHQWVIVDNRDNRRSTSISQLYHEALVDADHDLVFFMHQDVYLPHGWESRTAAALQDLEDMDARWGVIGAVGACPPITGESKQLRGRWCDPSGYHFDGPLPHEVQALDEQWIGVRKSRGITFDANLPGFHCYGIDISLSARSRGLKSYAIDSFVWHKFRDASGRLVGGRADSPKIQRRWSREFMAEFMPSADFVRQKWRKYLPFQTTSWNWDADSSAARSS